LDQVSAEERSKDEFNPDDVLIYFASLPVGLEHYLMKVAIFYLNAK